MFLLIKIGFTKVTQNWFRKRYSTFVPQVFSKLFSQTLLKICFTSVTRIDPQFYYKLTHKRYSKQTYKRYSKLFTQVLLKTDPQTLLKIGFTSVIQK